MFGNPVRTWWEHNKKLMGVHWEQKESKESHTSPPLEMKKKPWVHVGYFIGCKNCFLLTNILLPFLA
jgi:hypothetical protein